MGGGGGAPGPPRLKDVRDEQLFGQKTYRAGAAAGADDCGFAEEGGGGGGGPDFLIAGRPG